MFPYCERYLGLSSLLASGPFDLGAPPALAPMGGTIVLLMTLYGCCPCIAGYSFRLLFLAEFTLA